MLLSPAPRHWRSPPGSIIRIQKLALAEELKQIDPVELSIHKLRMLYLNPLLSDSDKLSLLKYADKTLGLPTLWECSR